MSSEPYNSASQRNSLLFNSLWHLHIYILIANILKSDGIQREQHFFPSFTEHDFIGKDMLVPKTGQGQNQRMPVSESFPREEVA